MSKTTEKSVAEQLKKAYLKVMHLKLVCKTYGWDYRPLAQMAIEKAMKEFEQPTEVFSEKV